MLPTSLQSGLLKPGFIDPAGDPRLSALSVSPPFLFRNATARVFPLEANVAVLTSFCDQYLNMDIPPTIVHYAPALPYVFLMVLNYGSMAPSSVQAQNVGWVAQHEVAFTVVLQRWREENNALVFKDWAVVSPFIYVDDELSLSSGREVYGWNKVTGLIEADIPMWVTDPTAPVRQFQLGLVDFADAYAGQDQSRQILLQIDQDPPTTFTTFPPDPRNPWSPLWAVPNAIANTTTLVGGVLDTMLSLRIRGFEAHRSADGLKAMAAKAREKLKGVFPDWLPSVGQAPDPTALQDAVQGLPTLFFDNVTLKQFRNPENPDLACYQALVKSKMGVDRLNRAGLLGDVNLLRGDTSGGYRLRVHEYDSQPIIQTLGLEVESWSRAEKGAAIATLKPILPYWLDVDLFYGKGEVICSRANGSANEDAGRWRDEQADAAPPLLAGAKSFPPYYNTALGAATQPIVGPFHFPDVTLQVYPLLADRTKLDLVLKNFLNDHLASAGMIGSDNEIRRGWRFESFGSYVYMMVTVYGDELGAMWSGANNIGGFFDREVTFTVPVKWYDENDELVTVAMIEPFTYSNNSRGVATDREVNGYNSIRATIDSPADAWLTPNGPIAQRRLLHLETEVIPALNVGQKAQQRTLIEVDEQDVLPDDDSAGWGVVADTWGRVVTDELKRKTGLVSGDPDAVMDAKALALEILAHGAPVNRVIVKQYRDGEDLDKACYQALVHATSTITSIYDVREMSPLVHVRMYRQPGHPIVDALGLQVKRQESSGGDVVDIIKPLRPFWMRIAMKEDLATVACFRSRDEPWQIVHPWFEAPRLRGVEPRSSSDTPERFGAEKPYFKDDGETRVGPWLARTPTQTIPPRPSGDSLGLFANAQEVDTWLEHRSDGEILGGNLHLDLKNKSDDWLRYSLINELAWTRVCVEPSREKLLDDITNDADVVRFMAVNIEPNGITEYCDLYSIDQMVDLLGRISRLVAVDGACPRIDLPANVPEEGEAAAETPSENSFVVMFEDNLRAMQTAFAEFFHQSTEGIRSRGLAWSWDQFLDGMITNHIFATFAQRFERLPEARRQAFLMSLPKSAYPLLLDSTAYMASSQYAFDTTFQNYRDVSLSKIQDVIDSVSRARILADIIDRGLLDWTYPTRWRRISRLGAAVSVESLDEVQLVIDDILSSEWENHDQQARFLNPKAGRKPTECMRLETPLDEIARTQGLERWIDPLTGQASEFWVVPMPGESDSIKSGSATVSSTAFDWVLGGSVAAGANEPAPASSPAPPSTTGDGVKRSRARKRAAATTGQG